MRLLYTLTSYRPALGGAQIHTHLLAQHLAEHHAVQAVCHWDHNRSDWLLGTTLRQPPARDYEIDTISVHRLGFSWTEKLRMAIWLPLYYPLMQVALPPIAGEVARHLHPLAQSADLIHNVRIGREGLSYASWQTACQYDIPFVFTPVHHPRWVGWRYRAYIELYRRADAVIALTPSEKSTLIDLGVAPDHIHVTGIGPVLAEQADAQRFRRQYGLEAPMVLFLGQHYPYKGFRQLLEAAPLVWQHHSDTQFVFIGPPVKDSDQVFLAYTDSRIHHLGPVDLQAKTDALAACDLLCVPSSQESFGGVFTEAWSLGKPVVGGRIPAVADVVYEGTDGFLVAQDPDQIAERICYLLAYPERAQAMGQAGQAKVQQHYTWPTLAQKTEQVYRAVLGI
ncbi:Glycosyltransferase Type 1 [Halomicronema hongdechloris C2206]|uniref:Glycosyltransferase Type 1 n=1 Tax=Halomicronema hongdechloris C2206 TaxID=1641165 RepID=A0A1Z3HMS8_9CYAN|nr:glycosyltransferase family 4 protein [Halomicronema hongdechloris]ASC71447.1 Glycosyltransferase Type 1 [Halomicronema hongdechloris C2206]